MHVPRLREVSVGVDILICARNEAANLRRFLPSILGQEYSYGYRVLVVDDGSTDDTERVLEEFGRVYGHLEVIRCGDDEVRHHRGKKHALLRGIAASDAEWLLLTDADCEAASPFWLRSMLACADEGTDIVLGYGGYFAEDSVLNRFVRSETVLVAMQYFSWALWGMPYMGVGRNVLYRRRCIEGGGVMDGHKDLQSGDDDLTVNALANAYNTRVCVLPTGYTYSLAKGTLGTYYRQKTRHFSTAHRYKLIHRVVLGVFAGSHVAFYGGVLGCLWVGGSVAVVGVGVLLLRWMSCMYIWYRVCGRLEARGLVWFFPMFDVLYALYYIVFSPSVFLYRQVGRW